MNLYGKLVKLGTIRKDLRPHIRPLLKTLRTRETGFRSASDPWGMWEQIKEVLGAEEALTNLMQYVGDHESREQFEYMARMWDIPVEIGQRDRHGDMLREFKRYFRDTGKLADEFAQGISKRLLKDAVEDIIRMYDLSHIVD